MWSLNPDRRDPRDRDRRKLWSTTRCGPKIKQAISQGGSWEGLISFRKYYQTATLKLSDFSKQPANFLKFSHQQWQATKLALAQVQKNKQHINNGDVSWGAATRGPCTPALEVVSQPSWLWLKLQIPKKVGIKIFYRGLLIGWPLKEEGFFTRQGRRQRQKITTATLTPCRAPGSPGTPQPPCWLREFKSIFFNANIDAVTFHHQLTLECGLINTNTQWRCQHVSTGAIPEAFWGPGAITAPGNLGQVRQAS